MLEKPAKRDLWLKVSAWFLAVSYGIGGSLTAVLEYRKHLFSERFDLPPELIYLTCAAQLLCAFGVFHRKSAPWAAAVLTVITVGAIASHLRIESPATALPALAYTAIQVWFGLTVRRESNPPPR